MSMLFLGLWELVFLFALGLGSLLPVPLGVPPRPEDPALLRAAPADALLFVQWFGAAEPDAGSANATERLAAEPEVRELLRRVRRAVRDGLLREAHGDPVAAELLDLAEVALQSPGCLFVSGIDPRRGQLQGGLVLSLGQHAARAATLMRKLESVLVEQMPPAMELELPEPAVLDGVSFRPLPLPDVPVSWGVADGYLVLAAGAEVPARIAAGLRGDPGLGGQPAFAGLHGRVRVARPCFRSFVDLERLGAMARGMGGRELTALTGALGFDEMRALLSETGLEGDGYTSRTLLALSGEPEGLLGLLAREPLSTSDLAVVPGDATVATALRCDPRALHALLRDTLAGLDPAAVTELDRGVGSLEELLGVRFEEDLLAHVGDVLSVWSSPGQGGLLFTGATAALSLRDGAAFGRVFRRVMARLEQAAPPKQRDERGRFPRGGYLGKLTHRGTVIYFLDDVGRGLPVAPAWCATDTHILFSLFPQMLKAQLDRGLDVATSLAGPAGPGVPPDAVAIHHLDARGAMQTLYPLLHVLAQLALSEVQREGFDLDIGALPSQPAVLRHLRAESSALARTGEGLLLTRQGTVPVADPVLGLALPLGFGVAMFRYRAVAAERMVIERERALRARREAERRRRDR